MNVDTGEIRRMAEFLEEQILSEKWVPVADEVAMAAKVLDLEAAVERLRKQMKED